MTPTLPALAPALSCLLVLASVTAAAQVAANDTRATAAQLPIGEVEVCNPISGNTAEGSAALTEPSCAPPHADGPRRDLWYYFVPDEPSVTLTLDATSGSVGTVYVEASTANGTSLRCDFATIWSAQRLRYDDLTAGDTVFLQIAALDPRSYTAFELCAFTTPTCEPPRSLNMFTGPTWAQLTWVNADNTPAFRGGRRYRLLGGPARFTPNRDEPTIDLEVSRSPINLYNLQPGTLYDLWLQEVCSENDRSAYATPNQRIAQRPAGPPEEDSLFATANPVNYIAAVAVTCFPTPGSTRGATPEASAPAACGGEADDDVWYRLSPQSAQYRFILQSGPETTADLVLELRDANLDLLACVNEAPGGGAEVYDAYDLTIDEDVYMRIYTAEAGAVADFGLCAFAVDRPVVVDTGCTDALRVTLDGTGEPGQLVDVLTATGEILVSIENTQDLGEVSVSYFGASDSVRVYATDTVPTYYARNNVTITPERQPSDSLTVRFYLAAPDIIALAQLGAVQGLEPAIEAIPNQPTGSGSSGGGGSGSSGGGRRVARLSGKLGMEATRVPTEEVPNERCSAEYVAAGFRTSVVGSGPHGDGIYLDVRLNGFSDFFFHGGQAPLSREVASGLSPKPAVERSLRVFPNPTTGSATVLLPTDAEFRPAHTPSGTAVRYRLLDLMGREVAGGTVPPGVGALTLELGALSPGVYEVVLGGSQRTYAARLVVR